MNNQSNISVTLEEIPFADLHISELNQRKVVNDASIGTIAENIRAYSLIQNLAGFRDEAGVGVSSVAVGIALLRHYRMIIDFNRLQ